MEAELEKLVQEMRRSGAPELSFWYHESGSEKPVGEEDFTSKDAAHVAHSSMKSRKVLRL